MSTSGLRRLPLGGEAVDAEVPCQDLAAFAVARRQRGHAHGPRQRVRVSDGLDRMHVRPGDPPGAQDPHAQGVGHGSPTAIGRPSRIDRSAASAIRSAARASAPPTGTGASSAIDRRCPDLVAYPGRRSGLPQPAAASRGVTGRRPMAITPLADDLGPTSSLVELRAGSTAWSPRRTEIHHGTVDIGHGGELRQATDLNLTRGPDDLVVHQPAGEVVFVIPMSMDVKPSGRVAKRAAADPDRTGGLNRIGGRSHACPPMLGDTRIEPA
jgi:hypothetical protein